MSIPILSPSPAGVCLVCKGQLTPDHQHVYVDKVLLEYQDNIIIAALRNGCMLATEEGIFSGHPRLTDGYIWYPVKVTHDGPHEGCAAKLPHHHCEHDIVINYDSPVSDK